MVALTPSAKRMLTVCGDIASAVFVMYWFYYFTWAAVTGAHATKPLQTQIILLMADVLPSVLAILWFSYRYASAWKEKYPSIIRVVTSQRFRRWIFIVFVISTALTMYLRRR